VVALLVWVLMGLDGDDLLPRPTQVSELSVRLVRCVAWIDQAGHV